MKLGKMMQVLAVALLVLGSALATPAQARGFRIRHIPIPHSHRGSSPSSSPQQDNHTNPWAKDDPAPQPSAFSGFTGSLMVGLLVIAIAIWSAFKFVLRRAQETPEPWSPGAAGNAPQSDFQQRLQQGLAGLEQPARGDLSRAPASAVLPTSNGGFGKHNF